VVLGQAATTASRTATRHRRIDAILLHRVWGYAIFAAVMWGLFASIFTFAAPLMDFFEKMLEGPGAWVAGLLGPGLLHDLWMDGIVAGVGGVLVFIPQIAVMFLLLSLLDESGYLARGAYLLDRALASVGLHGKSFVPMLSAHACAIPAVMSARAVEHPRERLATILVTPFLICGARLPVFALLIAACFGSQPGWVQGSIMWGLYVLGIAAAAAVAFVLRRTALKGGGSSFMIELTPYQVPNVGQVARTVWRGVSAFLVKAGTIILTFSVLLWAAMTFPGPSDATVAAIAAKHTVTVEQMNAEPMDNDSDALKAARTDLKAAHLSGSIAGHIGHAIEPVIAPFGADWKTGVGLVSAFAAREVFVSTLGVAYGASQASEEDTSSLRDLMLADRRADGSALWTGPFAAAILVWFVLAMQCMSTVAVMVRETKGWRWPLAQLIGMNAIAWIAAVATYRIGLMLTGT
jgi:ferrous iron transport protein B